MIELTEHCRLSGSSGSKSTFMSESIEKEFAVHQAICDERYKSIEEKLEGGKGRMQKIEIQLYIVIAAILFGPGVAADIVKKMLGL